MRGRVFIKASKWKAHEGVSTGQRVTFGGSRGEGVGLLSVRGELRRWDQILDCQAKES